MISTKTLFTFFVVFFVTSYGFSQDPQLFENTWYLHNFEYNDENHVHIPNNEVNAITLNFQAPDTFASLVCNHLGGYSLSWDNNNNSFIFFELHQTLGTCQNSYNANFENLYFQFYFMTNEVGFENQPFTYQIITNSDNSKTLTITNTLGQQAIYGNYTLSKKTYDKEIVNFHPNPVKDVLYLKYDKQDVFNISIVDIHGKTVLKYANFSLKGIDMSSLEQGIYFAKIATNNGSIQIEKIIKH